MTNPRTEQDRPTPLLDALEDASRDLADVPEWARPTIRLGRIAEESSR